MLRCCRKYEPSVEIQKTDLSEICVKEKKSESVQNKIETSREILNQIQNLSSTEITELTTEQMDRMSELINRLETVTERLERTSGSSVASSKNLTPMGDAPLSAHVKSYDAQVTPLLNEFLQLSAKIGNDINEQSQIVSSAFQAQRNLIILAASSKEPSSAMMMELMKPLSQKIQSVIEFKDKHRGTLNFNHFSAIAESIPALGWVSVKPTPAPYIKEMSDAAQFYTNRVLKEYKEKDPRHVQWTRVWLKTLTELQVYVKQTFTTGLTWNPKGNDAVGNIGGSGPPPPPGPPPPVDLTSQNTVDSKLALFSALNKGSDVTSGLKKVSDDMKTHKNPNLRAQSIVPGGKSTVSASSIQRTEVKRPSKKELQDSKWIVEYFENDQNILIECANPKQTVYIFKCNNCVIQVKGKANSIVLDGCKKTQIALDEVIASFDIINCQSIKCQVNVKAPTVSIDKTDGCLVYLSKDYANTRFVTAKSSEINISRPENDEYTEAAVPEQFITYWDKKSNKFVTGASESLG